MLLLPSPFCADTVVNGKKVDDTPCWVAKVYASDASSPAPRLGMSWAVSAGTMVVGLALQYLLR